MYDRTGNYLIVAILIGMILGVVVVAFFGKAVLPVKFLGDIFLNALKMVVIPLLFCSMVVGIASLGDIRKLGRTGLKTLLYFLVTSSISVVIGLVLVNAIQPGDAFPAPPDIKPIADQAVARGDRLSFPVVVIEPNEVAPVVSHSELPPNSALIRKPALDTTNAFFYEFTFRPDSNQVGTYFLLFFAADGDGASGAVDTEAVKLEVTNTALMAQSLMENRQQSADATPEYSFTGWLTSQIPPNIIRAAAETQVLPIIFFALLFGGILTTLGAKGKPVVDFIDGLNEAIMKLVRLIMWFAPIGIFGLVVGVLAEKGGVAAFSSIFIAVGKYSLVVLVGLAVHGIIVLPLILKFMGGKSPFEYFVGMSQALMTAFATASSSATLPVTMECTEEKNDIDKRASSFVLPLGATINMDGTALYEAVAAMFIAQAYGIALPIWSQITIFATAVLASVGAAGIPQAGLVTMVLVLQAVGLPLEGIGLILAIDWFLDRCRTTVNVWGDSIGAAVIATTAEIGLVDRRRLKAARTERPARFQRFTRRKDARGSRKPQESAPDKFRDRGPIKGKKSESPTKNGSRRPQKTMRKPDRFGGKRFSRKDQKSNGLTPPSRREEYKPREVETKEKAVKETPVAAEPTPSAEKPSATGQEWKKSTFGRRRNRPQFIRGKSQSGDAKTSKVDGSASDRADSTASEKRTESTFEIPKFPARMLDDLAAGKRDRAADKQVSDADGDLSKAGDSDYGKDPAEDFSRLDEAVLGSSESGQGRDETASISREEDDFSESVDEDAASWEASVDLHPDEIPEFSEDVSGSERDDVTEVIDESREDKLPDVASSDEPAMPESGSDGDEVGPADRTGGSDEAETDNDLRTDVSPDADNGQSDDVSAESGADSRSEESEDAASDDDESRSDSMKWGRPKHKKLSR